MVRILGYVLSPKKSIYIALKSIYGIGISTSKKILTDLNINFNLKVAQLSDINVAKIRIYLENSDLQLESDLKKFQYKAIKNLIDINCYRGKRHLKGLPVRGQSTRSNSRTSRKLSLFKKHKNV